jgi:hypothetical protein
MLRAIVRFVCQEIVHLGINLNAEWGALHTVLAGFESAEIRRIRQVQ